MPEPRARLWVFIPAHAWNIILTPCLLTRPPNWLPHHFDVLADRVATGMTIEHACHYGQSVDAGSGGLCFDLPCPSRLYRGIVGNPDLMALFRKAIECRIWAMADEIMAIADDSRNDWLVIETRNGEVTAANSEHIQRSKLRIETRLKLMGKLLPHVFGDAPPLAPAGIIRAASAYRCGPRPGRGRHPAQGPGPAGGRARHLGRRGAGAIMPALHALPRSPDPRDRRVFRVLDATPEEVAAETEYFRDKEIVAFWSQQYIGAVAGEVIALEDA